MKRLDFTLVAALMTLTAPLRAAAPADLSAAVSTKASQEATAPDAALARLLAGNARFRAGSPVRRDPAAAAKATSSAQYPFAAVLGCIDSRVAPETVFDQGIGDIFSARVAGAIVDDDVLASLEYATQAAGARLILVLGHTHCGAVKSACQGVELEHVTQLLAKIQPSVSAAKSAALNADFKSQAFIDSVAQLNVRKSVADILSKSATISALVKSGRVAVKGAMYDVETGRVTVLP